MTILHVDNNKLSVHTTNNADGSVGYNRYEVKHLPSVDASPTGADPLVQAIIFQDGPPAKVGINGVTNEALLVMLIHRTAALNTKFPCEENFTAIAHMRAALSALESRTAKRVSRGVDGKEVE